MGMTHEPSSLGRPYGSANYRYFQRSSFLFRACHESLRNNDHTAQNRLMNPDPIAILIACSIRDHEAEVAHSRP